MTVTDGARLRSVLEDAAAEDGRPMKDLTVLAPQNDPFRLDTPARHRDGRWFADTLDELGLGAQTIHLRGAHYALLGTTRPDGSAYTNTDEHWSWLAGVAKAARWLGYVPFERIVDHRNAEPVIVEQPTGRPWSYLSHAIEAELPDLSDGITPKIRAEDFTARQPFRLVLFGEKSSLEPVLAPLAGRYLADLYLMTGEISDTWLHRMARSGAADGRPMVVLTFSDADPAGWQMPISIGHKLRALREGLFPELDFEVYRVALSPDQVRLYGLPSTPLKVTEKRADLWRERTGVEQTEVDALASLRPDLLRELAEDALGSFFDDTLAGRCHDARGAWEHEAQRSIDDALDTAGIGAALLAELEERVDALRLAMNDARRQVDDVVREVTLPPLVLPTARTLWGGPAPLVSSAWSYADHAAALVASKEYRGEATR